MSEDEKKSFLENGTLRKTSKKCRSTAKTPPTVGSRKYKGIRSENSNRIDCLKSKSNSEGDIKSSNSVNLVEGSSISHQQVLIPGASMVPIAMHAHYKQNRKHFRNPHSRLIPKVTGSPINHSNDLRCEDLGINASPDSVNDTTTRKRCRPPRVSTESTTFDSDSENPFLSFQGFNEKTKNAAIPALIGSAAMNAAAAIPRIAPPCSSSNDTGTGAPRRGRPRTRADPKDRLQRSPPKRIAPAQYGMVFNFPFLPLYPYNISAVNNSPDTEKNSSRKKIRMVVPCPEVSQEKTKTNNT